MSEAPVLERSKPPVHVTLQDMVTVIERIDLMPLTQEQRNCIVSALNLVLEGFLSANWY